MCEFNVLQFMSIFYVSVNCHFLKHSSVFRKQNFRIPGHNTALNKLCSLVAKIVWNRVYVVQFECKT